MPRRTHEESLKYWDEVIRDHETSGLSIRKFCEKRRIRRKTTDDLGVQWRLTQAAFRAQ